MKKIILFILVILLFLTACKKNHDAVVLNPETGVVLNNNVHVIDSANLKLTSTPAMIVQGIYEFTSASSAELPALNTNDVIIGSAADGFIRQIVSVIKSGNKITLQTTQGNMESVFQKANFKFDMNSDSNTLIRVLDIGKTHNFNNITLFDKNAVKIVLNNGSISFNPNWHLGFNFKNSALDTFELSSQNGIFSSSFQLDVTAAQGINILETQDTLASFKKKYITFITAGIIPVPVVTVMRIDLICKFSAQIDASVTRSAVFTTSDTVDASLKYQNSQWQSSLNLKDSKSINLTSRTGNVNATIKASNVPTLSFRLYGVAGPYVTVSANAMESATIASPSLDYDFIAALWGETAIGANAVILGKTLGDYNKSWNTFDTVAYRSPNSINKISGDNQTAPAGTGLGQPVKVQVLDSKGLPQSSVPVYFTTGNAAGIVQPASILSDANGYAQANWTLGNTIGAQNLNVSVKKGNGTQISNSPQSFNAVATSPPKIKIGDSLAGGFVFFIDSTGQHGYVCAPVDQSISILWDTTSIEIRQKITGATGTTLGTGSSNTSKIIATLGNINIAAAACQNYNGGGFKDWFLPSLGELNMMYQNKTSINVLSKVSNTLYWTSSETPITVSGITYSSAYAFNLFSGANGVYNKYGGGFIRAIRAF